MFTKFPNGKVWLVDDAFMISGTVEVPGVDDFHTFDDPDDFYDAVSKAATGSAKGLEDINYTLRGGKLVSFTGMAVIVENEPGCIELPLYSPELRMLLAQQYGIDDMEIAHIRDNMETAYLNECSVPIAGSARAIHFPAAPDECSYVRVVLDGKLEIAYWADDEWKDAPAEVMGALLGALRSGIAK